jgi:hypothetical protein
MLDEAIKIVQQALNTDVDQTTGEGNTDMTSTPKPKEQEHGLQTVLAQLGALKGSGKVDEILRVG